MPRGRVLRNSARAPLPAPSPSPTDETHQGIAIGTVVDNERRHGRIFRGIVTDRKFGECEISYDGYTDDQSEWFQESLLLNSVVLEDPSTASTGLTQQLQSISFEESGDSRIF